MNASEKINYRLVAYCYFFLFTLCTIISAYNSYDLGYLGGDFDVFKVFVDRFEIVKYTIISLSFDVFFVACFYFSFCITKKTSVYVNRNSNTGYLSLFMVVVLLFILFLMSTTNVGSVLRDGGSNRFADLSFALLQPFYLAIIYLYSDCVENSKKKFIVFFLFIAVCILSGFTGYLLYLFPFLYVMVRNKLGSFLVWVLLGLGLILLPVLRISKYLYLGGSIDFGNFSFEEASRLYMYFLKVVVDRFSYVHNIIYIEKHIDYFTSIMNGRFLPFFQGYIGSFSFKPFSIDGVGNINEELYNHFSRELGSNATFPLISYFFISLPLGICVFLYFFVINTILLKMLSIVMDDEKRFFIGFLISYTLLLGGWFWPYMNFFQAMIVYIILIQVFVGYKKYNQDNLKYR